MNDESVRFDLDALTARVAGDAGAPEFPALAEALRRSGDAERARAVAEAGLESAPSRLAGRVALALARMDLGEPERGREQLEKVLDEMLEPYRVEAEPEAPLTPTDPARVERPPARPDAPRVVADDPLAAVAEQEIDAAFDQAEAREEEMHSPNRMAESILDSEAPFEDEHPSASASTGAARTWGGEDSAPFSGSRHEEPLEVETGARDDGASEIGAAARVDEDSDDDADGWDDDSDSDGHEPGRRDFDVTSSGPFATRTMAGLLEQQGDHERARSIRTSLDFVPEVAADPRRAHAPVEMDAAESVEPATTSGDASASNAAEASHRARVLATLERWLHNVQRGVA